MSDDRFLFLKRHVCAEGLSDDVIREIADVCELVRCEPGEYLHRANEKFDSVYLVVHGRIKQSVVNFRGDVVWQRHLTGGTQFGALAAALDEPAPIDLVAEDPSTLLRLDHKMALHLTKQHELFRKNFSRMIADAVMSLVTKDRQQNKPRLISVFHQSMETRQISKELVKRLQGMGEHPRVLSDQLGWDQIEPKSFCIVDDGRYLTPDEIREKAKTWSDLKRVFIDVDAAIELDMACQIAEISDKILWCVTPDNWKETVDRLKLIEDRAPGWRDKTNIIWLLPGDQPWAPLAPELKQLAKRDFKMSFDEPPENQSRELFNGIERVIHQLRGLRIGVALGGGAARGMAHLGVLKVLEQNGIYVDMIAGTSAGAMTGILYASGMEPDYNAARFVHDLKPGWLFRHLPNGDYWYLLSKYRRGQFDPMLRKYLGDSRLEQLTIPVYSVTVDLISGQPVVREEGDCVDAITESINLPVLSVPINRNGKSLVDGGIVNNIPADVLAASGCNFVIAVSVTASMEEEFASNRPDTPTSEMKSASAIKTILRTYVVQNVNMNSVGVAPADFVIEPDVSEFDITEFTRADEMSKIGAETTRQCMPKLKDLLSRIDDKLYAPDESG